ncbi:TrmJ/YjtD family RNA methyltransferase [Rhizorhabdus argentea]|uniref:TrmJ/YjtD family RNA methyltransferase n=1 Tax=Rhizorhabdus argentea TaxID=1387174 RepID=UPI0030EE0156
MSFWAYMLRCADDSFYVGHSDDLLTEVAQHQSGAIAGYTQNRRPVSLVWSEEFPESDQAFAVERQIKGWSRLKKQALIDGNWSALTRLAKKSRILRDETSPRSASPQDEREELRRRQIDARHPIIVLVRPQLGENIGKAARAMLNFGLTELRLVSPRDGWPNPDAGPAASGADIVLERAQVYDSVAEATADCVHVYATTVRKRGVTKPVVTPEAAAVAIHAENGRSAILFGPERSGLETDDVATARTIVTVPINPEFGSLNLAQAVILVAYEWSKGMELSSPPTVDLDPPAPQEELDGLIDHLERMLDASGYYFPPDRAPTTRRTLRSLLTKPAWNAQEIRTLRGVLSTIDKPRRR